MHRVPHLLRRAAPACTALLASGLGAAATQESGHVHPAPATGKSPSSPTPANQNLAAHASSSSFSTSSASSECGCGTTCDCGPGCDCACSATPQPAAGSAPGTSGGLGGTGGGRAEKEDAIGLTRVGLDVAGEGLGFGDQKKKEGEGESESESEADRRRADSPRAGAVWDASPSSRPPLPPWTGDIRADVEALVRATQDEICAAVSAADGSSFREDTWVRAEGGGGRTRVLQEGRVFEKGGVNVSVVHGSLPASAVAQMRARGHASLGGKGPFPFYATGISLVLHPRSPAAPTVHANYRYFEVTLPPLPPPADYSPAAAAAAAPAAAPAAADDSSAGRGSCCGGEEGATAPSPPPPPQPRKLWWFGGGADLTPSILFDEDAVHFHSTLKDACERGSGGDVTLYPRLKRWCDSYFVNTHRSGGERRGIGGIFFDDMDCATASTVGSEFWSGSGGGGEGHGVAAGGAPHTPGSALAGSPYGVLPLVSTLARSFLPAYMPILERRAGEPSTAEERQWQQLRRGRYVEFNLVHDRGTKFGLATPGARIESILMSLPLTARWEYAHTPAPGSEQDRLFQALKAPVDWVPLVGGAAPAGAPAGEGAEGGTKQ